MIARSSLYYTPKGETEINLALMRRIDEQFLGTPFFGVRQMTWHLRNEGHLVHDKRVRRLMRLMGLMPIYQKPNSSRPAKLGVAEQRLNDADIDTILQKMGGNAVPQCVRTDTLMDSSHFGCFLHRAMQLS